MPSPVVDRTVQKLGWCGEMRAMPVNIRRVANSIAIEWSSHDIYLGLCTVTLTGSTKL
jgi:hypothetical protein